MSPTLTLPTTSLVRAMSSFDVRGDQYLQSFFPSWNLRMATIIILRCLDLVSQETWKVVSLTQI
jgi:hypothetical protein